ncbi:MAG TPA: COR domain-containing protein [Aggregatilineales bacterium]|nr:COR domain-containing protein [Aggregatilineales bacterium]
MAREAAYEKAEARIAEAHSTGVKSLDLESLGLSEVPASIGQLSQLQTLYLHDNQLTSLPESLGQLTQLQTLDLHDNQLTSLPESLGQLSQLLTLDLQDNQLTSLPESLGQLSQLQTLYLHGNQLTSLPESLGQLSQLQTLYLHGNQLTSLPESLGQLSQLQALYLHYNQLTTLPESLGQLTQLRTLMLYDNELTRLPESLGQLTQLRALYLGKSQLVALPTWIGDLESLSTLAIDRSPLAYLPDWIGRLTGLTELFMGDHFPEYPVPPSLELLSHLELLWLNRMGLTAVPEWVGNLKSLTNLELGGNQIRHLPPILADLESLNRIKLDGNPLNPELATAYAEGMESIKTYLRAHTGPQITLNEAKLILVGEGEVGKSSLLAALRGDPWEEGKATTHGIEIKPVSVAHPESGTPITLNGWDFGGQRVYRPTHQLFFSAPAVYLVVWKPREGTQQGMVQEWIKLIKHRAPEAKILVVATHGGPKQRLPDIDQQGLRDLFGQETVLDFFSVESKPDEGGERRGIDDLKQAIGAVAASLPEVGRSVPQRWQAIREALLGTGKPYLPLGEVLDMCATQHMKEYEALLVLSILHRMGDLIHYKHDPELKDIVILKPDWLATAISYVLDDEQTRQNNGLVRFSRLSNLWWDKARPEESRYRKELHPIFVRLMERFDICYRVAELAPSASDPAYLIAQLVPDTRPESMTGWEAGGYPGDREQKQICRIVDDRGNTATAEGLFYQLIVRLHKYSLGRANYDKSIHWQRGLVLDADYNGRALLEHIGNDIRITVRAAYPEGFLTLLTEEVKYLVESFWEGLRCDVMVPCIQPCGKESPGTGLYEVRKLIDSKQKGRPEFPCPICNEWQPIDALLTNAPAARPVAMDALLNNQAILAEIRALRVAFDGRFEALDAGQRIILSQIDETYTNLLRALVDDAKEGPRLFSLVPVDRSRFNPRNWSTARFRLTLWCEHARVPLPWLNGPGNDAGVYELDIGREWFQKAAPFLKFMTGALSLVLPVASSSIQLALDDNAYKQIEEQLDFGKSVIESSLEAGDKVGDWLGGSSDDLDLQQGKAVRAEGGMLREFQALIKERDPGFGGLIPVLNKRKEFVWVHPKYVGEY